MPDVQVIGKMHLFAGHIRRQCCHLPAERDGQQALVGVGNNQIPVRRRSESGRAAAGRGDGCDLARRVDPDDLAFDSSRVNVSIRVHLDVFGSMDLAHCEQLGRLQRLIGANRPSSGGTGGGMKATGSMGDGQRNR